jgi:hypothetical protein
MRTTPGNWHVVILLILTAPSMTVETERIFQLRILSAKQWLYGDVSLEAHKNTNNLNIVMMLVDLKHDLR